MAIRLGFLRTFPSRPTSSSSTQAVLLGTGAFIDQHPDLVARLVKAQQQAVKWLRDGLGVITHASQTKDMATQVPDSHGVYMVPAFVGLGAPYWEPDARGAIYGLTLGATAAHLARAALESVAYQTMDLAEAMAADAGERPAILRVDGGMVVNDPLMQRLADTVGSPVERPKVTETTALGAAFLAGLQAGLWSSLDALSTTWALDRAFRPAEGAASRDRRYAGWQDAVRRVRSS